MVLVVINHDAIMKRFALASKPIASSRIGWELVLTRLDRTAA